MNITRRSIEIDITQPDGTTTTLTDLRMRCGIDIAGGYAMGTAQVEVFGVPLTLINKLTSIGANFQKHLAKNEIKIRAGDEGEELALTYQGNIQYAWGQFADIPNASLQITAYEGAPSLLQPANPVSYTGSADVATIMHDLATEGGYGFENDGVTARLSRPAYAGTVFQIMRDVADHAGINFVLDKNIVVIWPKNGARSAPTLSVSPSTGLVGYPTVSSKLTYIQTLFRPDIQIGTHITVEGSSIDAANGNWVVNRIQQHISAHYPDGPWFTNMALYHPPTS